MKMKRIWFLRHGKTKKRKPNGSDLARTLSPRGRQAVRKTARRISKKTGIDFDIIIASPAKRAIETADIVISTLELLDAEIRVEESLYASNSGPEVLELLSSFEDSKSTMLVVGHNPVLSDIIRLFNPKAKIILPTAGVVGMEFDTESWKAIVGLQPLVFFTYLNEKKNKYGLPLGLRTDIRERTISFVVGLLKDREIDAEKLGEKGLRRLCRNISFELYGAISRIKTLKTRAEKILKLSVPKIAEGKNTR